MKKTILTLLLLICCTTLFGKKPYTVPRFSSIQLLSYFGEPHGPSRDPLGKIVALEKENVMTIELDSTEVVMFNSILQNSTNSHYTLLGKTGINPLYLIGKLEDNSTVHLMITGCEHFCICEADGKRLYYQLDESHIAWIASLQRKYNGQDCLDISARMTFPRDTGYFHYRTSYQLIPSLLLAQLDSVQCDDGDILTPYESEFLKASFFTRRMPLNLLGARVAFLGRSIHSKKDYFEAEREWHHSHTRPIVKTLYIFNDEQKKQSGGYDAAICCWERLVFPSEDIIERIIGNQ